MTLQRRQRQQQRQRRPYRSMIMSPLTFFLTLHVLSLTAFITIPGVAASSSSSSSLWWWWPDVGRSSSRRSVATTSPYTCYGVDDYDDDERHATSLSWLTGSETQLQQAADHQNEGRYHSRFWDQASTPADHDAMQRQEPSSDYSLLRRTKKTGTTIAGCVVMVPKTTESLTDNNNNNDDDDTQYDHYVVLAADTRATEQTMVADKTCSKIHPLTRNCWCCGAGTSADLDKVTRNVLYSTALQQSVDATVGNGSNDDDDDDDVDDIDDLPHMLHQQEYNDDLTNTNNNGQGLPLLTLRPASIDVLCNTFQNMLYRSRGQLGVNLIVGGVWHRQAYLCAIHPHGSVDRHLPFTALGSGGLAAMSVLEQGYYHRNGRSTTTTATTTTTTSSSDSAATKSAAVAAAPPPCHSLEEGIRLVQRAVLAGIENDLGSGSQVDLCVIYPDGTSQHTRCSVPEQVLEEVRMASRSGGSSGGESVVDDKAEKENEMDGPTTSRGVNGFGNQPFAVESARQRVVSIERDEKQRALEWDRVLGLQPSR